MRNQNVLGKAILLLQKGVLRPAASKQALSDGSGSVGLTLSLMHALQCLAPLARVLTLQSVITQLARLRV